MTKLKKSTASDSSLIETLSFSTPTEFRKWLQKNHDEAKGLWLRIWKVHSEVETITYAEALDEALCFGWIDGQKKSYDSESWVQKFTPRKAGSQWSQKNTEHVARLIKAKKMAAAGLREVNAAKKDGRWKSAYKSSATMEMPEDFLKLLAKNKKAKAFFATLNKANLYAIYYRLHTAKKPETRTKRMTLILEMLANGETFH